MKLVAFFSVLLALALWGRLADAHATKTAALEVATVSSTDALVTARGGELDIAVDDCRVDLRGPSSWTVHCARGWAGATLTVTRFGEGVDVVLARLDGTEGTVITPRAPTTHFPGSATSRSVLERYLALGVRHVLSGVDHVLFLLALFWCAFGRDLRVTVRRLFTTASLFTVAHSVTLAATALGWLRVRAETAEALIAASLVFAALDCSKPNVEGDDAAGTRTFAAASRALLPAAFGLVHGLGFAGALAETGLPSNATVLGLLGFNLGVELGQLALLSLCLVVALVLRHHASRVRLLSAYAVGGVGAWFFLARTSELLTAVHR